jgi:lysophospholipase L1-like esterase
MADIASDSRIGGNGAETNTTYFSGDDVHPNNVGYAIIAGYYASAIQAIP